MSESQEPVGLGVSLIPLLNPPRAPLVSATPPGWGVYHHLLLNDTHLLVATPRLSYFPLRAPGNIAVSLCLP